MHADVENEDGNEGFSAVISNHWIADEVTEAHQEVEDQ